MIQFTHVDGKEKNHIVLFTLSTCVWCRKTKRLLDELGLGYEYVDVDLLAGADSDEAKTEMTQWNPRCSFPTMVVNNERCVIGFNEEEIRRLAE